MSGAPVSANVYYKDVYWNDHDFTREMFARRIGAGIESGPEWWPEYFFRHYLDARPAKRALFLNCGNGWVERHLYDLGIFEYGVGFDYLTELLAQARSAAGTRRLSYFAADCNTVAFEDDSFDLIVNYAAMHHVQFIDRLNRLVARALVPDGYYVNFDYVGPHRNQYGKKLFGLMERINGQLPKGFRAEPFVHPSLPTMLAADPTEAIHSELIFAMFYRYFYPLERRDLNGGIAYQIMHNNHELFLETAGAAKSCVRFLLELDELHSTLGNAPPLFSFFVGRPRKYLFNASREEQLREYTREEAVRESYAAAHGGAYEYSTDAQD